jgi:hypothetical protein
VVTTEFFMCGFSLDLPSPFFGEPFQRSGLLLLSSLDISLMGVMDRLLSGVHLIYFVTMRDISSSRSRHPDNTSPKQIPYQHSHPDHPSTHSLFKIVSIETE